jgi:hypothetical protein
MRVVEEHNFVGMITADDPLIDRAATIADSSRRVAAEVIFDHSENPVQPASGWSSERSLPLRSDCRSLSGIRGFVGGSPRWAGAGQTGHR